MEPSVFMIHAAHISAVWPQVAPILEPAVRLWDTHDIEDVRKEVMSGNKQLWVDYNSEVKGAAVTEFVSYPKGLWLRIWLFGIKKGVEAAWDEFEKKFIEFAKLSKCTGIEHIGRDGWERRNPKVHQKHSVIYRMAI